MAKTPTRLLSYFKEWFHKICDLAEDTLYSVPANPESADHCPAVFRLRNRGPGVRGVHKNIYRRVI